MGIFIYQTIDEWPHKMRTKQATTSAKTAVKSNRSSAAAKPAAITKPKPPPTNEKISRFERLAEEGTFLRDRSTSQDLGVKGFCGTCGFVGPRYIQVEKDDGTMGSLPAKCLACSTPGRAQFFQMGYCREGILLAERVEALFGNTARVGVVDKTDRQQICRVVVDVHYRPHEFCGFVCVDHKMD